MFFNTSYNRTEFLKILQTKICPDFVASTKPLECTRQTKFVKDQVFELGKIKFSDKEVAVLEIKQLSDKDPRITLTKDAFKLLHDHQKDNALIAFWSDNAKSRRLSLLTSKYEGWDKVNSNPKRYSFLLGEGEKTKTPEKYLIEKGIIRTFEDLVSRFDVEVVRKEFFKLYMNLFLELYGEVQNNPTFSFLIEQKKIEPVSFAKNLMGKMIFLYFIQKKGWLGIDDKNKPFGIGDRDFFKNNFDKLAHEADLFQKHSNFYNDFLEPLFYSGLNKKNPEDWHPSLHMKVPYLNGGLFQEEYDRKNTIINLNNQVFKNIIRSFDTYNFTIDEDDAHDREIAVDPEMLGKIFESMISVSRDNIDQIMDVYTEAKAKKKIEHPNPENILNIDIGKEINKKFGAFYTPREIVHYMTKESLIAHLVTRLHEANISQSEEDIENIIRKLFEYKDKHLTKQEIESEKSDGYELLKRYVFDIQENLKSLKILDPAVGSGAFPMGILQEILGLRRYLIDTFDLKSQSDFEIKKQIVQNSIYGVDIDPGAIDIARLRFRLSLIVDADHPVPLPNLDFKFVCANSLIPLEGGSLFTRQDIIDELARLRLEYFVCSDLDQKELLKKRFSSLQMELSGFGSKQRQEFSSTKEWKKHIEELVKQNTDIRNRQIMEWDPFDTNGSNGWFDMGMMFGIHGFDIVIGNPPYVNIENIDEITKRQLFANYKTIQGRSDLYIAFMEIGLSMGNLVSYIIPYAFTNQNYGQLMREKIINSHYINQIIDTTNYMVFESANVKNIVFLIEKKKKEKLSTIKRTNNIKDFDLIRFDQFSIDQNIFLRLKNSRIETKPIKDLLEIKNKLEINSIPLERICLVAYGARINHKKENIPKSHYIKDIFEEGTKPYLEGKNIERFWCKQNGWLKYSPEEHYNAMFPELFENKKLMFINVVSDKLRFCIDESGLYNSHTVINCVRLDTLYDCNHISAKKAYKNSIDTNLLKKYDLKFLLGILNSNLINRYFVNFQSEGLHFYPDDAKKLPIINITNKENLIEPIIILVNKILERKKGNPTTDTSDLEKKIDQMVYELYGLTEEEIKIVEESVK